MAVKIKVKSGDPKPKKEEVIQETYTGTGKTTLDDTADVRDIVTGLVGRGYTSLSDESSRASYSRLKSLLGDDKANKLMTHVFIQNQLPEKRNMPVEARIKSFYDTPTSDTDLSGVLGKVKSFGYGVLPGFRESSSQINQQLAGRTPVEVAAVDPTVQKVRLKVGSKLQ